jgi:hypothetical protein
MILKYYEIQDFDVINFFSFIKMLFLASKIDAVS